MLIFWFSASLRWAWACLATDPQVWQGCIALRLVDVEKRPRSFVGSCHPLPFGHNFPLSTWHRRCAPLFWYFLSVFVSACFFFFFWFFVFLRQAQTRTLRDHLFFLGALRIFRHWSWYYPWSNPLPWDLVREGCRPLSHNLAALRSRMLKDRQYPSHRMDIVYVFFFFGGEGLCDIRCWNYVVGALYMFMLFGTLAYKFSLKVKPTPGGFYGPSAV